MIILPHSPLFFSGVTTVLFESTPVFPDAGRYWDLVQKYKVSSPSCISLSLSFPLSLFLSLSFSFFVFLIPSDAGDSVLHSSHGHSTPHEIRPIIRSEVRPIDSARVGDCRRAYQSTRLEVGREEETE
jgi:hypothetical protein